MNVSGKPRNESRTQFDLLMEIYDRGRSLDTKGRVETINKFLALAQPGSEKQVNWGWFFKSDRAARIVNTLRKGLDDFRESKAFMRPKSADELLAADEVESFEDGIAWDSARGRVMRVGSRDPRHLFFTRVFELLTEVAPWLRVCEREDCRRFFLFQRPKQIYCSDVCAQRVRMARFLAQRKPVLSEQNSVRRR